MNAPKKFGPQIMFDCRVHLHHWPFVRRSYATMGFCPSRQQTHIRKVRADAV